MDEAKITGWRKPSGSAPDANCVEVGRSKEAVGIRDTKNRSGGTLIFGTRTWTDFITGIKDGEFDL